MKHHVVVSLLAGFALLPALAQAMDCKKAESAIEHMICAEAQLLSADAAMAKAYASVLKATDDADIRAMLVSSQRRWVAARDTSFGDLANSVDGQTGEGYSKEQQQQIVLNAIQERTRQLGEMANTTPKRPRLIQAALEQRAFASRFSGGAFAGFESSCDFLPYSGTYSYGCFGTRFYQHNNRICSVSQDWASGSVYEVRAVANVVDGKPTLIATCKSNDNDCASSAGWSIKPGSLDADTQRLYDQRGGKALARLDGEVDVTDDREWLESCLTDPHFPAAGSAN